uniref:Protein osiris 20 n=1 Tax=Anopheles minimus TaxID=112268 RepID=A0A1Y9IVR7_9DIPT
MMPARSCTKVLVVVVALIVGTATGASIASNLVEEERPRIASSEELLSSIVNECFDGASVMGCLKGKVLLYLDGMLGLREEEARSFADGNVDEVIFDRVGRVLATHEIRVQLPEETVVSYRADKGLDIDVLPAGLATVLLLLKLKMKALMPIFLGLIGLKAMKALILSKLAITLVLGFLVAQLVKKSGLGMPMSMMPMMPPAPAAEYGAPVPASSTPASSYEPSSWESSSGPYSRHWEPSTSGSSHSLAYSSYYPSASGSSSYTAYNAGSSSSSAAASGSSSSSSSPSSGSSSSPSSASNAAHAY